jgi:lipocalin
MGLHQSKLPLGVPQASSPVAPVPNIPQTGFQFDPSSYGGYWIEVGRYADPQEAVCNDVALHVDVKPGGHLEVLRSCSCSGKEVSVCGEEEKLDYVRISSNTYQVFDRAARLTWSVTIVWTDYRRLSLVASPDRLWIYRRSDVDLTEDELARIYRLVVENGFDPSKVILTGLSVTRLGEQHIHTSTLIAPFCLSPEGAKFKSNVACQRSLVSSDGYDFF